MITIVFLIFRLVPSNSTGICKIVHDDNKEIKKFIFFLVHILHLTLTLLLFSRLKSERVDVFTAVDFFNQVNLLYGTLTEFCTPENCPTMTAGPK